MKLCFPIDGDRGMASEVSAHFGSAPMFAVVDTDTGDCRVIENSNHQHDHGGCRPLASLEGCAVDVVVTRGIGPGALDTVW